ncbi:obscurin, partial [Hyalella azteca]|uniref:Obscurin n=1 Tax=Hyalella azteca TaxID=294128 RepID=A0A8B7NJ26_HYAAZ
MRDEAAEVYSLVLDDVTLADAGAYSFTASNEAGEATGSCKLHVHTVPPSVSLELRSQDVCLEDVATFTLRCCGLPLPVPTWTKKGAVQRDDERTAIASPEPGVHTITFRDVSMDDYGKIEVVATSVVGTTSSSCELTQRTLPCEVLDGLENVTKGAEGDDVTLTVVIRASPRPVIVWMKDGREVRPSDVVNAGLTADGQFFLEFRHVTADDAGTYCVVAVNDEGRTEATVKLDVTPPPSKPEFLQELRPTKVITGYPCRMQVKCGGYPAPQVSWLKDGQPLTVDGQHIQQIVLDDGTVLLQLDVATDADAGRYTCVARNADGEMTSSAPLAVLDHVRTDGQPDGTPTFTSPLKDVTADEGKTLRLPVAVRGGPVPNMTWYKDGKPVKLDDRVFFTYDGDRSFLEIRPCRGADAGEYRCVLEGEGGATASTSCIVTVRKCFEAPSFAQGFNAVQQLPGLDIRLTVRADGVPRPELSWFKDGKPIDFSDERYKVRKDG